MKARGLSSRMGALIQLFSVTANFPLLTADAGPLNVGSGEPGLHIMYTSKDRYVVYLDEPGTVGSFLIGGYDKRQIQVVIDRNFGLKEILRTRSWGSHDMPEQLYPYDEQTAFTCDLGMGWSPDGKTWNYWPRKTRVFSTNADGLLISDDVYALACSRYGLTTNQLYLGKIGTNIYYWETRNPAKVYYRGVVQAGATNYLELPKRVVDLLGVTKAIHKGKDIGFMAFEKSPGIFHYAPYTFDLIEVSFKDTKRVSGKQ